MSCALDGTVRTWDLPSGYAVDRFKVESIATSVTFSPSGDFLATSHVNSVGICLWANRTQFSNVMLRRVPDEEQIASIAMPAIQAMEGDDAETENVGDNDDAAAVEEAHDEDALIRLNYQTPEQLADGMITLSMEPKSKWQTLLNLDTIKVEWCAILSDGCTYTCTLAYD